MTKNLGKGIIQQLIEIANVEGSTVRNSIAQTILKLVKKKSDISISEVSEIAFTSISSVTKFCQSLGYSGFKEFSTHLKLELTNTKYWSMLFQQPNSIIEIMHHELRNHTNNLNDIFYCNFININEIVNLFMIKKRVYLFSEEDLEGLLTYFYRKIIGMNIYAIYTTETLTIRNILERNENDSIYIFFALNKNSSFYYKLVSQYTTPDQQKRISFIAHENEFLIHHKSLPNLSQTNILISNRTDALGMYDLNHHSIAIILHTMLNLLKIKKTA